jgi:spoIIIJ-associated protein
MTSQEFEKLKKAAEEFFKQTGLELEVEIKNQEDSTIFINLTSDEPQFLIGEKGQTLSEIQRLLRAVLRRKTDNPSSFFVDLDVNEYKKKKAEYLKEMAQSAADEVAITKREKEFSPMSPYERRVVHMELAARNDIITESIGEEPLRRVKIKPRV